VLEGIESELVSFQQQGEQLAAELQATVAAAESKRKAVEPVQTVATKTAEAISAREAQMKQMAAAMAKLQADLGGLTKAQAADRGTLDANRAKLNELEAAAEAAEEAARASEEKAEFFKSVYGA
jgi:chromosome segregation ATPase